MNLVKNLIRLIVLWPIYWLSKLVPKNRNVWCFGSPRDRFVDNAKYMYLYTEKNCPNLECYWVVGNDLSVKQLRKQGINVVKRSSLKGMWTILRADVVLYSCFVSEVSFWLSGGAKSVNLWHGLPLKKIEFDIKDGPLKQKYSSKFSINKLCWKLFNPVSFRKPDLMFSPSEVFDKIFASAFRIDEGDNLVRACSPRTDMFFDNDFSTQVEPQYQGLAVSKQQGLKNILYMPTFRDVGDDFFASAGFDFSLLNEVMLKSKSMFYIKAHPNAGLDGFDLSNFSNVKVIPPSEDPYSLLNNVDILITDYSSIYIDFLLLERPIIFYAFDLNEYLTTCRDMYFLYEEVTPGNMASNFSELLSVINSPDEKAAERKVLKDRFWGKDYVHGCRTLIEVLQKR